MAMALILIFRVLFFETLAVKGSKLVMLAGFHEEDSEDFGSQC